jgi:hypothetical protein
MAQSKPRNFIALLVFSAIFQNAVDVFASEGRRHVVRLYVFDYVRIPEGGLNRAIGHVRNVFHLIDVDIRWLDSKSVPLSRPEIDSSWLIDDSLNISIAIINRSGSAFRQVGTQVVGFTPKSEGKGARIYIFYDHVLTFARASTVEADGVGIPPVLGSAIAHEIGHVLLTGSETHSSAGIMRFRLGASELKEVIAGKLTFTPAQADLIHSEIERRLHPLSVAR